MPNGSFLDNADAILAARELGLEIRQFRTQLGASALSASAMAELLPVLADSIDELTRAQGMVEDLEEKEVFGDEDSYWNVFRLFCSENNRGNALSLGAVWGHLAMTYDMSAETPETLADTLAEWTADIEADALTKFKLMGQFKEIEGNYGFVVIEDRSPKPRVRKQQTQVATPVAAAIAPEVVEQALETSSSGDIVMALSEMLQASNGGSVRQADFIREIQVMLPDMSREEAIEAINDLHASGSLIKYKPTRGGAARICLDAVAAAAETERNMVEGADQETSNDRLRNEAVDYELATSVIHYLIDNLTHVQQKVPTSTIHTALAPSDATLTDRDVNTMIRALEGMGVVETDRGALLGGGGKKLSKGKTRQVLRVGLASQEVKVLVKRLIDEDKLDEYLQALTLFKMKANEMKSLFGL